jgi:hypothetical protein
MDWRQNSNNEYTAYAHAKGKPINFQVTRDGRYVGYISNYDPRERTSRPELYVSGKCHTADEAMDYIEELVEKLNRKPEDKTPQTNVAESTYVENLAKTLEETPAAEEAAAEEVTETPTEVNHESQDNFADDKVNEPIETESSQEPHISFQVEDGTMTITADAEGTLKYTTNGREVNASSKIYKAPFSIEGVETVKVKLYDADKNPICDSEWTSSTN